MNALANTLANVQTASLDYETFKKAMTNACRVVEKRNTIPILDCVLITAGRNGAQILGTDMDIFTTTFVPGKVDRDFFAIVDAHKLKGTMDKVKDAADITFTLDGFKLTVMIGKLRLTLNHEMPREDYPMGEGASGFRDGLKAPNASFLLSADKLRNILSKVEFAISTEETRYYLNGVFMHVNEHKQCLAFVTTDGHRAALYEIPTPAGAGAMAEGVIIPRKTVAELHRLLKRKGCPADVMVTTTAKGISFLIGEDELLESKVVDGTFPDYQRVYPQANPNKAPVPASAFIDALKQASAIMTERGRSVKLTLTPGHLVLTCTDPDFGTATTELTIHSDVELEIGFNSVYLLQILGQLDGGAMFELGGPGDPALIRDGGDDGVTYVMMPMRV